LREAGQTDIEQYVYDDINRVKQHILWVDEADLADLDTYDNLPALRDANHPGKIRVITGYAYDILGNQTKVMDPRAYRYLEMDTDNRAKYTTTTTYDVLNRVEKVMTKVNGSEVYKQFTYDEVGNTITEHNERGFTTTYTYDSLNRVLTMTNPNNQTYRMTYDLAGNKLSETNALGHTMSYT
jgi:YD repeat-containing protein